MAGKYDYKLERGSREWRMMADLFILYQFSVLARDEDDWNEEMFNKTMEFQEKYKDIRIALELSNVVAEEVIKKQKERST